MGSLSQSPRLAKQGNSVLLTEINYFSSAEAVMEAENKEKETLVHNGNCKTPSISTFFKSCSDSGRFEIRQCSQHHFCG